MLETPNDSVSDGGERKHGSATDALSAAPGRMPEEGGSTLLSSDVYSLDGENSGSDAQEVYTSESLTDEQNTHEGGQSDTVTSEDSLDYLPSSLESDKSAPRLSSTPISSRESPSPPTRSHTSPSIHSPSPSRSPEPSAPWIVSEVRSMKGMQDKVFDRLKSLEARIEEIKTNSEDFRHKSTSEMLVISEGFQRMELSIESLTLQMGTAHVIEKLNHRTEALEDQLNSNKRSCHEYIQELKGVVEDAKSSLDKRRTDFEKLLKSFPEFEDGIKEEVRLIRLAVGGVSRKVERVDKRISALESGAKSAAESLESALNQVFTPSREFPPLTTLMKEANADVAGIGGTVEGVGTETRIGKHNHLRWQWPLKSRPLRYYLSALQGEGSGRAPHTVEAEFLSSSDSFSPPTPEEDLSSLQPSDYSVDEMSLPEAPSNSPVKSAKPGGLHHSDRSYGVQGSESEGTKPDAGSELPEACASGEADSFDSLIEELPYVHPATGSTPLGHLVPSPTFCPADGAVRLNAPADCLVDRPSPVCEAGAPEDLAAVSSKWEALSLAMLTEMWTYRNGTVRHTKQIREMFNPTNGESLVCQQLRGLRKKAGAAMKRGGRLYRTVRESVPRPDLFIASALLVALLASHHGPEPSPIRPVYESLKRSEAFFTRSWEEAAEYVLVVYILAGMYF